MFNYDRAIYETIDDEIQLCLIMNRAIYKTVDDENTTLFNYDSYI